MKFIRMLFLFLVLISLIYFLSPKPYLLNEVVNGPVYISGRIINIYRSGNHSFGIYELRLDTFNVPKYEAKKGQHLPYQLRHDTAEVYATIGAEDPVGYRLILNSVTNLITIADRNGGFVSKVSPSLIDDVNSGYVCAHTIFQPSNYCK